MMSLWDALRMNMMISYQELVRTFPRRNPHTTMLQQHAIYFLFSFTKCGCSGFIIQSVYKITFNHIITVQHAEQSIFSTM